MYPPPPPFPAHHPKLRPSLLCILLALVLAAALPAAGSQGSSRPDKFESFVGPGGEEVALFRTRPGELWRHSRLWRTDGTAEGTFSLELCQDCDLRHYIGGDAGRYFQVSTEEGGDTFGWSDGTIEGTRLMDAELGESIQVELLAVRHHYSPALDRLLFLASDQRRRLELWSWDGRSATPPSRLFSVEGSRDRSFLSYADAAGQTFLTLLTGADGSEMEVFVTDGTPGGTRSLGSLPAPEETTALEAITGGVAFITTGVDCTPRSWAATAEGGLAEVAPLGETICEVHGGGSWSAGGKAFFALDSAENGTEMWATDGTGAGTRRLTQLERDDAIQGYDDTVLGDHLFFFARAPNDPNLGTPYQLWRSDGTPEGTVQWPAPCFCSGVFGFQRLGDRLWWITQGPHDHRLWVIDGMPDGAQRGAFLPPDSAGTVIPAGDRWFYLATEGDPFAGNEVDKVWVLDPGAVNFRPVAEIPNDDSLFGVDHASVGRKVVFANDDGFRGAEPWVSDGTAQGTGLLLDIVPAGTGLEPPKAPVIQDLSYSFETGEMTLEWAPGDAEPTLGYVEVQARGPGVDWERLAQVDSDQTEARFHRSSDWPSTYRVREVNAAGSSPWSEERDFFTSSMVSEGFPDSCVPTERMRCFEDGRFGVRVFWWNQHHRGPNPDRGEAKVSRPGQEIPDDAYENCGGPFLPPCDVPELIDEGRTGYFWFFDPKRVELVVKMLDGGSLNQHAWLFYGALTDVEYWVTVEDFHLQRSRTWRNPPGEICGLADTTVFPSTGGASGALVPATTSAPASFRRPAASTAPCVGDATTLCLLDGRFAVTVDWAEQHNQTSGVGRTVPFSDESGFFWFFREDNVELVVKVLDGTRTNGHFWVFYGALTDVGYVITVTDTETGQFQRYVNEPGNICGGADTTAF